MTQVDFTSLIKDFNASIFWQFLGIEISEVTEGYAETKYQVKQEHLNINGTLHGGIYTSLLDSTMGLASRTIGLAKSVTLQLNTQFLGAVTHGELLTKAKIIHRSRSTALIEGKLFAEDGTLLAFATATFRMG